MLHRHSILTALIMSLLLSNAVAASHAPTLTPQIYLPHAQVDSTCGAPPQIPPALGSRRLAYISGQYWNPAHTITVFDPATNHAEPLIRDDSASSLAWSPDATQIAYWSLGSTPGTDAIKLLRIADRQVTTIASSLERGYVADLSWSPDGQQIAFGLHRNGPIGEFSSIMVVRPDGTQMRQLSAIDYDSAPAWSPDGQKIAFVSVQNKGTQGFLYLMDANGGNPTPIADGLGLLSKPVWSPDGQKLAFLGSGLFTINADGTGKRCLRVPASDFDNVESWSPDGRQIAYIAGYEKISTLRVVNVDGSGYSELYPLIGSGTSLRWAPR